MSQPEAAPAPADGAEAAQAPGFKIIETPLTIGERVVVNGWLLQRFSAAH